MVDNIRVPFSTCDDKLGSLSFDPDERVFTEAEQEIGVGMTIYFRQIKFLVCIFALMTFLSVPSFYIYSVG